MACRTKKARKLFFIFPFFFLADVFQRVYNAESRGGVLEEGYGGGVPGVNSRANFGLNSGANSRRILERILGEFSAKFFLIGRNQAREKRAEKRHEFPTKNFHRFYSRFIVKKNSSGRRAEIRRGPGEVSWRGVRERFRGWSQRGLEGHLFPNASRRKELGSVSRGSLLGGSPNGVSSGDVRVAPTMLK